MIRKQLALWALFGFLIGIHNGFVAVWKDEDPEPIYISGISASALPPADRARLEKGIHLADGTDLARALEDYCS